MTVAMTDSVAFIGADAHVVHVEVDIGKGVPGFRVVGLPNASVREAEQRVRSALLESEEPWTSIRKTANLAPGYLRKEGTHFDLALALGVAGADGNISVDPERLEDWLCVGELALDGRVQAVRGVIAAAMAARDAGKRGIVCPLGNAPEAALVDGIEVVGVATLREALDFFKDRWTPPAIPDFEAPVQDPQPGLLAVRGHAYAKRALEIAAAGGHNLLVFGVVTPV